MRLKHSLKLSLISVKRGGWILLSLMATYAQAVDTISLPDNPVTIPECNLTVGPGIVDYGSKNRGQLRHTAGGLTPGQRTVEVNAVCTVKSAIRLRLSGPECDGQFCWGTTGSRLRVRAGEARLDSDSVLLQKQDKGGHLVGETAAQLAVLPGDVLSVVKGGQQVEGRQLNIRLTLEPVLLEADSHSPQRASLESVLSLSLQR